MSEPERSFEGTITAGHKEHAVEVPFDPASEWGVALMPIRGGRRGYPVRATVASIPLDTFVVARSHKHWLVLGDEALEAIGVLEGDVIAVKVVPRDVANP